MGPSGLATSVVTAMAFCVACLMLPAAARGETVTLQSGVGGYAGCTTATLWAPGAEKLKAPRAAGTLAMRGSLSRALLRFDLPAGLRPKKLARARLEVFVPEARDLRMICEILCREAGEPWSVQADWTSAAPGRPWQQPGGSPDIVTDYRVGRPPGAVDSYSLWEYNGQYFPHRYAFLGVPKGGTWIDFNVTPRVRKWLADPSSNRGVVLEPMDQADKRFPNRALLDIPAHDSADAAHRPRLVLEFEPLAQAYLVGMTHTLEKFCDRDTRYRFRGPFSERYEMAMARNEFEGFQVLVYPMIEDLKGVALEWTDLAGPGGATIPKADVAYWRQDVLTLHRNEKVSDWYFHGKNFEVPDPLVTAAPADCPVHMATPFWFTVRTRPETRAGLYRGKVTVRPQGAPARDLELAVKVWDYVIPEKWNFQTMGQTCWDPIRQVYGRVTPELKRRYIDFLLDHRFNPTEQYADRLSPDAEDIPYVFQRGGNTIYLSGNFTGNTEALRQRYEAVRKLGLIDSALVYIGDETSKWDEMRRRSDAIRRACPELAIMIGGSFPRPELDGVIDIFDPQIDLKANKVYSLPAQEMRPLIAASQAKGEKFFWYVAAGPMLPCPNVQMEDPLIASRVLFWMTWKFGVTGFEYYCYNIWKYNVPGKDGKRWPEKPFSPRGWGNTNGDGMLFYPGPDGPFSSVRFENIRDGIEDWESHRVLADCVAAVEAKAQKDAALRAKADPFLARARAILAVPDEVCGQTFADWTWEPDVLLAARRNLGDTIEEFARLVSPAELQAASDARRAADRDRTRAMLKARAAAAQQ